MKKVLITGASGFAGGFLAEHLLSRNEYEVFGTYHSEISLEHSPVKNAIHFVHVDLVNTDDVFKLIQDIQPDILFHLAAASAPSQSFKNPIATIHTNIDAELTLLEAVRQHNLNSTKILLVSSGEIYGYLRPEELPVDEETPFRPTNPYSVSKIAQDYLGLQYFLSYKLPIIRIRPFNHIGPRQSPGFVVADFAKQIAEIEKGLKEPIIKVGNLDAKRDFTDVRDIVRGYTLLMQKGEEGEVYNIGSGVSWKIQDILDMLLSFATVKISVEVDQEKVRPSDIPEIVCNNSKLVSLTKWQPTIPMEQSLKDTLEYWRGIV